MYKIKRIESSEKTDKVVVFDGLFRLGEAISRASLLGRMERKIRKSEDRSIDFTGYGKISPEIDHCDPENGLIASSESAKRWARKMIKLIDPVGGEQ